MLSTMPIKKTVGMVSHPHDAMTFSITTPSIVTLYNGLTWHLAYSVSSAIMLSVIMLSVAIYLLLCWMVLCTVSLCWMSLCCKSWRHLYCLKFKIVIFLHFMVDKVNCNHYFLNLSSFCEKDIYQMSQIFAFMVLEQMTVVGQCRNTFKIGNFEFKSLYLESTALSLIL